MPWKSSSGLLGRERTVHNPESQSTLTIDNLERRKRKGAGVQENIQKGNRSEERKGQRSNTNNKSTSKDTTEITITSRTSRFGTLSRIRD